jgi:RNA polymerase sigma factor (TIGR02999 family)
MLAELCSSHATMPSKDNELPITALLQAASDGDTTAQNELYNAVYADLFRVARHRINASGSMTVLDGPGLVSEAYLRMIGKEDVVAENRRVFFSYAAKVMRNVVLDHVKASDAEKRGGGVAEVSLHTALEGVSFQNTQLLALDQALERLKRIDERAHNIVELRYFAGLSMEECAEHLGLSVSTATRAWDKARVFLATELA